MRTRIAGLMLAGFLAGCGLGGGPAIQTPPATAAASPASAPAAVELWVDPANGDDGRSGASRAEALRTLDAAWRRIPQGAPLSDSYRIWLMPGLHPEASLPNYLERRYGTAQAPITIQSSDGRGRATLGGDLNIFDVSYLNLIDLVIAPDPPGDALHCEQCDHLLLRGSVLDGGDRQAHETVKINQSQYVELEDNEIRGADDNAVDFVAVQHGRLLRNRIHNAGDWCAYAKGGSAYLVIEANEFYDCGTGGFSAGQGTGFQFMTSPWLHYEAYDLKIINNLVRDTEGAGLGVNGGYNILLAYNTLYRVGSRSHALEFVYGSRSCDGQPGDSGRERCGANLAAGGWGTTIVDDGSNYVRIPNRHLYVYNNLLYNPAGFQSQYAHFAIPGPAGGGSQTGSNVPIPARSDDDLRIRGNLIWNGPPGLALGIEEADQGCQPANSACNAAQLRADNAINTIEPQLVNPGAGDFRPTAGSSIFGAATFSAPDFSWADAPATPAAPAGSLSNAVAADRAGFQRVGSGPPGAYVRPPSALARRLYLAVIGR